MNLTKIEGATNNCAYVVQIGKIYDIPKKDLIKRTVVNGFDIIVSKDIVEGDLMLYFISQTQLSKDLCYNNNLYDKPEFNKDVNKKGYISVKRRLVKCLKMAGVDSDGILLPLSALSYIENFDPNKLKLYDEFNCSNGVEISTKFVESVGNKNDSNQNKKSPSQKFEMKMQDLLIPNQFKFHFETPHLGSNVHKLNMDDNIVITAKLHGSSNITSRVKTVRPLNWKDKIAKFFGVLVVESEYGVIFSSGKPKNPQIKGIDSKYLNPNKGYYSTNIWKEVCDDYKHCVESGISLYGEICNTARQKNFDYGKLWDSGKDYAFCVYRITRTNDEGNVDEFTWEQVEAYCKKYNLKTVPVLFKGKLKELVNDIRDVTQVLSGLYLEKDDEYCFNKVPSEGICVRRDFPFLVLKFKSAKFRTMESKLIEETVADVE